MHQFNDPDFELIKSGKPLDMMQKMKCLFVANALQSIIDRPNSKWGKGYWRGDIYPSAVIYYFFPKGSANPRWLIYDVLLEHVQIVNYKVKEKILIPFPITLTQPELEEAILQGLAQ